jgi:hypothetical protein
LRLRISCGPNSSDGERAINPRAHPSAPDLLVSAQEVAKVVELQVDQNKATTTNGVQPPGQNGVQGGLRIPGDVDQRSELMSITIPK